MAVSATSIFCCEEESSYCIIGEIVVLLMVASVIIFEVRGVDSNSAAEVLVIGVDNLGVLSEFLFFLTG